MRWFSPSLLNSVQNNAFKLLLKWNSNPISMIHRGVFGFFFHFFLLSIISTAFHATLISWSHRPKTNNLRNAGGQDVPIGLEEINLLGANLLKQQGQQFWFLSWVLGFGIFCCFCFVGFWGNFAWWFIFSLKVFSEFQTVSFPPDFYTGCTPDWVSFRNLNPILSRHVKILWLCMRRSVPRSCSCSVALIHLGNHEQVAHVTHSWLAHELQPWCVWNGADNALAHWIQEKSMENINYIPAFPSVD